VMFFMWYGLTSLGLVIPWRIESTQGFNAIMNLILIPLWLLSGAFFPASGVPPWLVWAMRLDPLTYSVAALRRSLYLGNPVATAGVPPLAASLAITVVFALLAFLAATGVARRSAP
ncbi:MAG: ABC transporter permease, partial [Candidatus Methylomirabilales bacterium]